MNTVEGLRKQNPNKWFLVTDLDTEIDGGLYAPIDINGVVLKGRDDASVTFNFLAGAFIPLDIKEVTSGATGTGLIGFRK